MNMALVPADHHTGPEIARFLKEVELKYKIPSYKINEAIQDGKIVGLRPVRAVATFCLNKRGFNLSSLTINSMLAPAIPATAKMGELIEAISNVSGVPTKNIETHIIKNLQQGTRPVRALLSVEGITIGQLTQVWEETQSIVAISPQSVDKGLLDQIGTEICKRLRVIPIGITSTGACKMVEDVKSNNKSRTQATASIKEKLGNDIQIEWVRAQRQHIAACLESLKHLHIATTPTSNSNNRSSKSTQAQKNWKELSDPGDSGSADRESAKRINSLVNKLMTHVISVNASDIHISTQTDSSGHEQVQIQLRVDGELIFYEHLPTKEGKSIINRFRSAGKFALNSTTSQDGRYSIDIPEAGRYDLRLHASPKPSGGTMMVIRVLAQKRGHQETLEDLFPSTHSKHAATLKKMVRKPEGVLIVTGKTGSGKSTTLAAMLSEIAGRNRKLITIEDPIEYLIPGAEQIQASEKYTFPQALRGFLRADPDVIMIGELRDETTATTALHAAQTGHLVLSTLHANNASATPTRLLDIANVKPSALAETLLGVFAQKLLRRLCQRCSSGTATREAKPVGCNFCNKTGWKGRIAVAEFMPITEQITHAIKHHDSDPAEIRKVGDYKTLADHTTKLIQAGITTREEASQHISGIPQNAKHEPHN